MEMHPVIIFIAICVAQATGQRAGAVYTHWGRDSCTSARASQIYSGYVGGSHFLNNQGGGSNYLCLPSDPTYNNYSESISVEGSMYGAEYMFDFPFQQSMYKQDATCAVCQVQESFSTIMIPARTTCYEGWTVEYTGYLVSEHPDHFRSEFICLDKDPVARSGSEGDDNGVLFYPIEGICGSLPCPPYQEGWELACVVCSN